MNRTYIDYLKKHHFRKIYVSIISMNRPRPNRKVQKQIKKAIRENGEDDRWIDQYIRENEYVENEIIF